MAASRYRMVPVPVPKITKSPLPLRIVSDGTIIKEIYKDKNEDSCPSCRWFVYIYSPHRMSTIVGREMAWPEEQVDYNFSFKIVNHVSREELKSLNLLEDGEDNIPGKEEKSNYTQCTGGSRSLF